MDQATKVKIDPDDILQDVYVEVARQIVHFEHRGEMSFVNWVLTILDHKLIDAWRAVHCKARDIDREVPAGVTTADSYWNLLDTLYAASDTPSRVVRREEALDAVLTCIGDLTPEQRRIIHLRFLAELPVGEVARQLGKSEAAVVALTARALTALRESMNRLGDFTRGA